MKWIHKKHTYATMAIFIVAIVLAMGFSYLWMSGNLATKDSEIASLRQTLAQQDNTITSLQGQVDNAIKFTELYLKGRNKIGDAWANQATAHDYYDWGSYFYEYDNLSGADEYWTYSMNYFFYASQSFRESKPFFSCAEAYAPNEDYRRLVAAYAGAADSGAKLMDYMYEAAEYYAMAARYYSQGKWDQGDSAIKTGGERISAHDNEVPTYNDYLAEIESIITIL